MKKTCIPDLVYVYIQEITLDLINDLHVCFVSSSNATALTVNNIVQELRGVCLFTLMFGKTILAFLLPSLLNSSLLTTLLMNKKQQ